MHKNATLNRTQYFSQPKYIDNIIDTYIYNAIGLPTYLRTSVFAKRLR